MKFKIWQMTYMYIVASQSKNEDQTVLLCPINTQCIPAMWLDGILKMNVLKTLNMVLNGDPW